MTDVEPRATIAVSLGGQNRRPLPSKNPLKRARASLDNDDEDDEHQAKVQNVSHFDHKAGGAIDKDGPKKKGPLVIAPQLNRDWKEAGKQRRQRSVLPGTEESSQQIASIEEAERKEKDRVFGLNVMEKSDDSIKEEDAEAVQHNVNVEEPVMREKTLEQQALDSLLGVEKQSSLVVPAVTEADAFQNDFRSAPEMASLADYERVPVEEFGAAMLRGMGWKDGEGFNKGTRAKKAETPQRRPALLGIGAKSDAAMDGELGGWGKAARGKEIKIYNPVLLKDKKTGELLTEAELQQKKDQAQRLVYEQEFEQQERDKERRRKDREARRSSRERDRRYDGRRDDERRSKRDDHGRTRYDDERRYDRDRRERDRDGDGRKHDTERRERDRDRDRDGRRSDRRQDDERSHDTESYERSRNERETSRRQDERRDHSRDRSRDRRRDYKHR